MLDYESDFDCHCEADCLDDAAEDCDYWDDNDDIDQWYGDERE